MPIFNQCLQLPNHLSTRQEIRHWLINEFLKEVAGTGKGSDASKYIYQVEQCLTGNVIELVRPTNLNKGMDFTIHLRNIQFRNKGPYKDRPKHQEIIDDLSLKKQVDPIAYQQLANILNQVYHCQSVNISDLQNLSISAGLLSCEEVVLIIKWLWIEQDITYWNYSGRGMLYSTLQNLKLI